MGGVKPRVSQGAFDDLLGGFNPTSRYFFKIMFFYGGGVIIGYHQKLLKNINFKSRRTLLYQPSGNMVFIFQGQSKPYNWRNEEG